MKIQLHINKLKPSQGKVLISEPFLDDDYFRRTVVLLVEHNENGSFGLILNKPMEVKLNEAITGFPEFNSSLHFGGPVNKDQLFYLHTHGELIEDSVGIKKGLYWGGDFDRAKALIKQKKVKENSIRFFAGYSGWEPGQLEDEMKAKSWIVCNASVKDIMSVNTSSLWRDVLKKMGKEYAILSNFPEDPSLN